MGHGRNRPKEIVFCTNMGNRRFGKFYKFRILQNPELKKNTRAFFGQSSAASETAFEVDKAKFFENQSASSEQMAHIPPAGKVGCGGNFQASERLKNFVNESSRDYRRDAKNFFGGATSMGASSHESSRGSQF